LEIQLPASFPEKYKEAVVGAADLCAVNKHFETSPKINVSASIG
jgi:putative redox protein